MLGFNFAIASHYGRHNSHFSTSFVYINFIEMLFYQNFLAFLGQVHKMMSYFL